jgi:hypothetical protein
MPTTYGTSIQNEAPAYSNALELAETSDVIDSFILGWCGLIKKQEGVKDYALKRISKPTFTYEFAYNLGRFIFRESNRITGRTTYDKAMLSRYNMKRAEVLRGTLQHEGFPNMISEKAWYKIIELSQDDLTTKNENNKCLNFWQSKYNIVWNFHSPVNIDMLNIIKTEYGIVEPDYGQHAIMRQVFLDILIFLDGSLNRSRDALTLSHEKVIHKESYLESTEGQTNRKEGMVDNAKTAIRDLLGRDKNQI